jgi:hypothetical protein
VKLLPACVVFALGLGCAHPGPQVNAVETEQSTEELDVLESVFRYQFDHNGSGRTKSDLHWIFLAVEADRDPPHSLLSRFLGNLPPVEPVSQAEGGSREWGVARKGAKGEGIIFEATAIRRLDDDTFEVDGGYYHSNRSSSENRYRVERHGDRWVVVSDHLLGVS